MDRKCSNGSCSDPEHAKGKCNRHYRKDLRASRRPTTEQRYEAKVDRSGGPDACHPWTRSTNKAGYGLFAHDGETLAARWAYKHYIGDLLDTEMIRHTCDTPGCQNQSHWIKGTNADNMRDMVERGRSHHPVGSKNPKSKITEEDVKDLRRSYAEGAFRSQFEAADHYGVSQATVSQILRGETWKHV
jgi:hypothetical protein